MAEQADFDWLAPQVLPAYLVTDMDIQALRVDGILNVDVVGLQRSRVRRCSRTGGQKLDPDEQPRRATPPIGFRMDWFG